MSDKFKNKYTIKSTRLEKYDYSRNGLYFVTICTKDREEFFGSVIKERMVLSEIGKIIQDELLKTPIIRSNVILDEWIIMPNHLHMIIEIINQLCDDALMQGRDALMQGRDALMQGRDALQCVSTNEMEYKNKFGPQINNLASIIRGFKGIVTKRVHMCGLDFQWQPRFYDHIIRDSRDGLQSVSTLNRIREYIQINPKMWERDRNNLGDVFM